jgi:hypothetical protein
MERDMLLAAWQDGVPLREAWWAFADPQKKQLYINLESEGLHLEMLQSLKDEVVDRLYTGHLDAFGVEIQTGNEPTHIPEYCFTRTATIDWVKDTVSAFEKVFHNVRVKSKHEQSDEPRTETELAEPTPTQRESSDFRPQALPGGNTPPKAPGRHSKAPEIDQAIDHLIKQGLDPGSMPRPQAYNAVLRAAAELGLNTGIGFSDPVIQRCLLRRFGPRR